MGSQGMSIAKKSGVLLRFLTTFLKVSIHNFSLRRPLNMSYNMPSYPTTRFSDRKIYFSGVAQFKVDIDMPQGVKLHAFTIDVVRIFGIRKVWCPSVSNVVFVVLLLIIRKTKVKKTNFQALTYSRCSGWSYYSLTNTQKSLQFKLEVTRTIQMLLLSAKQCVKWLPSMQGKKCLNLK